MDLVSMKEDRKKEAVKKVIAAMTIGTKSISLLLWLSGTVFNVAG